MLVFEIPPTVVAAALAAIVRQSPAASTASKTRGTVMLILGFVSLLHASYFEQFQVSLCILDRDISTDVDHADAHAHHTGLNHIWHHMSKSFGLADHKVDLLFAFH
jgi:hypothetical protein